MSDEVLNLLAGRLAQGLGPAEIGRVGLDQVGVELMLPNNLAEAVADFWTPVIPVGWLRRDLFLLSSGLRGFGERANFLNRADADAIGFAQCSIDSTGLRDSHFGTMNQRGNIGRIGVPIADKTFADLGFEDCGCERPSGTPWIAQLLDGLDMNPSATAARGEPEEARMGDIPAAGKVPNITVYDRNLVLST